MLLQDRQQTFMLIMQQWQCLQSCKRAGRRYDLEGLDTTQPGSLAVPCRTCPHRGENLLDNWDKAPPDQQYVDSIMLQTIILLICTGSSTARSSVWTVISASRIATGARTRSTSLCCPASRTLSRIRHTRRGCDGLRTRAKRRFQHAITIRPSSLPTSSELKG